MDAPPGFLLASADPPPVELIREDGRAPLVLTCEHGGRAVPAALAGRMPPPADMARHIAFDLGAAALAQGLARRLGAALALQRYSRLVIDCNRPRHAADLVPAASDGSRIPFNQGLDRAEIERRWQAIHQPFHRAVAGLIRARGRVALVAVHSFTPQLQGRPRRTMAAGLLVRQDRTLAAALMAVMRAGAPGLELVFNAPYRIEDGSDYTIPAHGEAQHLPHVLVEIRNDLLADDAGVGFWTDLLGEALEAALPAVLLEG